MKSIMPSFELKCINTIRALSADQAETAAAGHPGAPMGCAPIAYLLWSEVMKYSSKDPNWMDRDRFVLSNGHACALQYSMLHLTGYDLSIEDLKHFRSIDSKTPGHPESFQTPGVELTTGPLGQGISNAVGLAIAERHLASHFNESDLPIFDHYTYVLCGDGCLQEGISGESGSLAGHLGLGKLIVLYDDNQITIDGDTALSFTEDVLKRYEAYGWHTQTVTDVEETVGSLRKAIETARSVTDKPSIIKIKTIIGYGSPGKQGTKGVHGAPLGKDELRKAKEFYELPPDEMFYVPEDVQNFFNDVAAKGDTKRKDWEDMFSKYSSKFPDKASEISRRMARKLPEGLFDKLPTFKAGKDKDLATRKHSHQILGAIAPNMPELIGGSADLTPSNLTDYDDAVDFQKDTPEGRYIRFGVREHAMVAISNGIFAHGGLRPYCATFLNFAGYCAGAIRLSALSKFGVIFVMTHDSIGLGEDGPTHQPIETLEMLRATPNLNVYRPVKAIPNSSIEKACKGAYVAQDVDNPSLIIIATGSEVGPSLEAASHLSAEGVPTRVVSMPCQEVFLTQPESYQREVLPGNIPTLAVEASAVHGWHRFSHTSVSISTFGMSGPGEKVMKLYGYSAENIAEKGKKLDQFYKDNPVPSLHNHPDPFIVNVRE
ncbi:transketolase [Fistulifera solaris]|uniref:transketolase n=1 Tax=Fistulifera solaris TaxID=1519565 RepID=A0A1Z5K056_FISSO|nr:transketolase [Fistulifera solaris]|eukprot:GAX19502.1 transketolase [Fistulifera solaris]